MAARGVFRGVFPAASLKLKDVDVGFLQRDRFSAGYSPRPH